ncbi:MAG: tetratricopeptide repeat protein [Gammaproteobacteria bacterium]|nr:tetratricopeptide repeat protein [Pseudomonadales bacterium]MCP5346525.1 tetratricopeptide repeat protein [Pseudomonadales bacterium]
MLSRLPLLLSLSIMSACATYNTGRVPVSTSSPTVQRETPAVSGGQRSQPSVSPAQENVPPEPVPESSREPATPASTLMVSVDDAIAAGDLERAAAISERALRISPRDAYLWYRLADIRYQQGQYTNAEGFARRAQSFAGDDRNLSQDINLLLSRISQASR